MCFTLFFFFLFQPFFNNLATGNVKICLTPYFPLDTEKLKKDGVTLTPFIVNQYLDSFASSICEFLSSFLLFRETIEVTLDENSNEGKAVVQRPDPSFNFRH